MLDHADLVNAAFVSRHGDGRAFNNHERLNVKYSLAKTMLLSHYAHLTGELDRKASVTHDVAMEEWGLILNSISLAPDVSRYAFPLPYLWIPLAHAPVFRARDTLFDAVHPLLQAIGSYAGCHVSLIAGRAEKDETDRGFFTA